jgi:hypothetical protein
MRLWTVSLAILLAATTSQAQVRSGRPGLRGLETFRGQQVFRGGPAMPGLITPAPPFYSYYPSYFSYYSDPYYSQSAYPALDQSNYDQSNYNQINSLSEQVQRLTNEVQLLQMELAAAQAVPPEPLLLEVKSPTPAPPVKPVLLIYRNGHRLEIHGYAIVGQTLYTTYEDGSKRIPLSDLNIDAMRKENLKRGINFLP